ncbi:MULTISPECIES: diguanylate cyclase [unclassified Planococcus (in: firmicutes)]|uniref:histidine kinase N-terminal 7TM domain-containing diguanylate cyclase n=1 Tax=unclassified Planococcus (in: firmicutes) TaxID=2662419 RepID=UPI0020B41238|nr:MULTISPECIES: diguanylate cyclase [unclassified Planococcus (in: firmicutes)]
MVYLTLICTSTVFILFLLIYVFRKRHNYSEIAHYFLLYTAAIGIYCFASGMALMANTLGQMKFWTIIQYVGMPFSAPLGLLFIMRYLGINVTRTGFWSLMIVPSITLFMVITNDWHGLHYRVFEADPAMGMPFIYQEIGTWYAVHGLYIFSCMFVAFGLLLSKWKETARAYLPQLVALLFGQLLPMLTAFLYLIGVTPSGLDPVPMVLWLSSVLYFWAISSSTLFAIMPVAKDIIFNNIKDGVIVLDKSHRLIEFNRAAKNSFPLLDKSMYGMEFQSIWLRLAGERFPVELASTGLQEIQAVIGHSERIYQISASTMKHGGSSEGLLLIFTDVTELKKLQEQLERQAFYDELTQVYNRRAFLRQCEENFAEAIESSAPFSVILMDIDHFKAINDTYGHDIGDQVLVHIAQICRNKLQEGQIFARYGGEEFVLALKGHTVEKAEQVGNELRNYLQLHPLVTGERRISATVSMGVAQSTNGSLQQLLKKADIALYAAKQNGRDQVSVYKKIMGSIK